MEESIYGKLSRLPVSVFRKINGENQELCFSMLYDRQSQLHVLEYVYYSPECQCECSCKGLSFMGTFEEVISEAFLKLSETNELKAEGGGR